MLLVLGSGCTTGLLTDVTEFRGSLTKETSSILCSGLCPPRLKLDVSAADGRFSNECKKHLKSELQSFLS